MRHVVAGTAGHIDHGKTALVRALTGIDTDRLEEEKRRGISIDLGFAHLDLPDKIRIALIDVPGHEKFIKNMLAGVGGIDMVLFVVAADESIKPQTREHLDICQLLRVPAGVIAVTKSDLVDADLLQLVQLEIRELVSGTFLESAPMIPVSAVSGAGIADLREALSQTATRVQQKNADRMFRMPVDRVFTMTGFGTVVTGTLTSGTVSIEDHVQAYPTSATFRVRGIQVHGQPETHARAGQRAALNLTGDSTHELARGVVLSKPRRFRPTTLFDCSLEVLSSAGSIKNGAPVHFHFGTAEIGAEVRILESKSALDPGHMHMVRLALNDPALLLPGDRFIIRRFSPVETIGGGQVIDPHPPRMSRSLAFERARAFASAPPADRVRMLIEESEFGLAPEKLIARTGETERAIIDRLPPSIQRFGDPPAWLLDQSRGDAVIQAVKERLREFHRATPLAGGIGKEELRVRYMADAPSMVFDTLIRSDTELAVTGDVVHLRSHKLAFRAEEEEALGRIERAFEQAGLAVPAVGEVLQKSGVDLPKAKALLQILLKKRRLVKITDELVYHERALNELRALLRSHQGQSFSVADFKEWTGVSRKYAIPLLEFLDRERVTRRQGDVRVSVG